MYFGDVQPPQSHGHNQSATLPLLATTYGLQMRGGKDYIETVWGRSYVMREQGEAEAPIPT